MVDLKIASIDHGAVIDHIPTEHTIAIMNMLSLGKHTNTVTVAFNLDSKKLGKKGIIKISHRTLSDTELYRIALIAEGATVNIIKDHHVVKKIDLHIPNELVDVATCPNARCITNSEGTSKFIRINATHMKCYFCEKVFTTAQIFVK